MGDLQLTLLLWLCLRSQSTDRLLRSQFPSWGERFFLVMRRDPWAGLDLLIISAWIC